MFNNSVDNLGIAVGQINFSGGLGVGYLGFVHMSISATISYARFIQTKTRLLIHSVFYKFSSVIVGLYTLSTGLTITTIYINTNTINKGR